MSFTCFCLYKTSMSRPNRYFSSFLLDAETKECVFWLVSSVWNQTKPGLCRFWFILYSKPNATHHERMESWTFVSTIARWKQGAVNTLIEPVLKQRDTLWLWSLTLIQLSLWSGCMVFQGKCKSDTFSSTLSIKTGTSRSIFFYQNAALIDGLRFMSCSSDVITHTTLPSIHIFFASTFIPPLSLFTCSPSTLSLSHHRHPPSVLCPMCHISLPPHFHHFHFLLLFLSLSPPYLHLSVRAQGETVVTSSSRILISHFVF